MGKIVITGLHGYISNAIRLRFEAEGAEVSMLDMKTNEWETTSFTGVDTVIHAAGLVHKRESGYTLEEYRQVNTELTLSLAQKAKAEGVRQFVFISSMSVYGAKASCFRSTQIDEDAPMEPTTKYGISKLEAEQRLRQLSSEDFCLTVIRPPFVYGPNCKGNYVLLRSLTLRLGVIPRLPNRKSILYIDNLTEFVYGITVRRMAGTFMPQNGELASTWEIASAIAEANHRRVWISSLLNPFVRLGSLAIGKFRTAFGSEYYAPELSKACGFPYQIVSFRDSVRITEEKWKNS